MIHIKKYNKRQNKPYSIKKENTTMEMTKLQALPDLLSPEQVADYLAMSTEYVYRSIKRGTIKARKLGNKWRIPKIEVIRITSLPD